MAERIGEYDPDLRKRQLRRRMIVLAKLQGPHHHERWVPASAFLTVRDDQNVRVADELEAIELLDELVELKLLEEWHPLGVSGGAKHRGFSQRRFKLTDRGYALWAHELDPIPSIADERLGD